MVLPAPISPEGPRVDPYGRLLPLTTLLAESEGADYREHGDSRGKVRMWHLGRHIGVFQSMGAIGGPHAERVIEFFQDTIERHPRPWYAFGNWSELDAYTSAVRTSMTRWQQDAAYDGLFVSHRSRLVTMGVNIANAVLPQAIRMVDTEEALDDLLVDVRRRVGV